jgi:hypothetical protein
MRKTRIGWYRDRHLRPRVGQRLARGGVETLQRDVCAIWDHSCLDRHVQSLVGGTNDFEIKQKVSRGDRRAYGKDQPTQKYYGYKDLQSRVHVTPPHHDLHPNSTVCVAFERSNGYHEFVFI